MKKIILVYHFLIIVAVTINAQQNNFPNLTGPYLGQKLPGKYPQLFATEIMINEQGYHSSIVFSPDLKEAIWRPMEREGGPVLYSKLINDTWTQPKEINFGLGSGVLDPIFSVDGNRIYFLSFQPIDNNTEQMERIWCSERVDNGWSKGKPLDKIFYNHPTHWTFSVAKNGNLYFTSEKPDLKGICISRFKGKNYLPPQFLFDGSMPFVSPDESYMIYVLKKEDTKTDLFIRYKNLDGTWTSEIEIGPNINSDKHDLAPYVSPDGKYLFFISQRERMNGIMWMSAKIIEELRPNE
ncbi:MAG: hypothetical protein MUE91_13930 [Ignavibacteriaceae bacterium]|nr:hypothetical protein [Ignavibacteriaceae bacterium]MCU0415473.1 hypothetical protein [Ignavibacteriaceae bacterium]